jgi:hypothetical protein
MSFYRFLLEPVLALPHRSIDREYTTGSFVINTKGVFVWRLALVFAP